MIHFLWLRIIKFVFILLIPALDLPFKLRLTKNCNLSTFRKTMNIVISNVCMCVLQFKFLNIQFRRLWYLWFLLHKHSVSANVLVRLDTL